MITIFIFADSFHCHGMTSTEECESKFCYYAYSNGGGKCVSKGCPPEGDAEKYHHVVKLAKLSFPVCVPDAVIPYLGEVNMCICNTTKCNFQCEISGPPRQMQIPRLIDHENVTTDVYDHSICFSEPIQINTTTTIENTTEQTTTTYYESTQTNGVFGIKITKLNSLTILTSFLWYFQMKFCC